MRLVTVSIGRPEDRIWEGRTYRTSIFRTPVEGRVRVGPTAIDGTEQADTASHGGPEKAVYGYALEHYPTWQAELPDAELTAGAFGENLTTEGLLEESVHVGDRYRIGTAELVVVQPRFPCKNLNVRFARADMVDRFLASRRSGIYFSIGREGDVGAGDSIERIDRDGHGVSIAEVVRVYVGEHDPGAYERVMTHPLVPARLRERIQRRAESRR
jgi:MOSC domain-containing protein YiiM